MGRISTGKLILQPFFQKYGNVFLIKLAIILWVNRLIQYVQGY